MGEPPLTGRELRLLVAMLDINGSNTLSRQEFEDGLRDCRWVSKGGGGGGEMTMLDINSSNTLTCQEFENGLRDCRWGGKGGGGGGNDHAGR